VAASARVDLGLHGTISLTDPNSEEDGDVEMPEIHEIEDAGPKRPARRTAFKSRKMMGNTAYLGRDRIRPANFCFTIVTACMIFIPSLASATIV
jgi:hypothetical protein